MGKKRIVVASYVREYRTYDVQVDGLPGEARELIEGLLQEAEGAYGLGIMDDEEHAEKLAEAIAEHGVLAGAERQPTDEPEYAIMTNEEG